MNAIMKDWTSFILSTISSFLMSEPVCYLTALLLLSFVLSIFLKLIYGKGGK